MLNWKTYLPLTFLWLFGAWFLLTIMGTSGSLLWTLVGTVWAGLPMLVLGLYRLTIRRIHGLSAFQHQGWLYRLFSGRLLVTMGWVIYSLVSGYLLLFWLLYFSPLEWLLAGLTIGVLGVSFNSLHGLFAGEFKPYMVVHRALGFAARLVPVGVTLIYALTLLLTRSFWPVDASGAPMVNVAEIPAAGASELVRLSLFWSAEFNEVRAHVLGLAGQFGLLQIVLVLVSTLAMMFNLTLVYAAFLIPAKELRRILSPLVDTDHAPAISAQAMVLVSAWSVLILFFMLPGLAAYLEQEARRNPQALSAVEQVSQQALPLVEQVGARLVRPGTIAEAEALRATAVSGLTEQRARLESALNAGFDRLRGNVDSFLDSYYSLPQEYLRLWSLLRGDIEGRVYREFNQRLLVDDPFADYDAMVEHLLTENENLREDYQASLEALLRANAVAVAEFRLLEARSDDSFSLPITLSIPAFSDTGSRAGAGVVSGTIVAAIVTKLTAKGTLKTAVMALTKVAGGKLASGAAGAASGAVLGSVVPGPGTAAGAAIGAVIGIAVGVSVDALLLQLEEELNREQFRAEIVEAIDLQQREMQFIFSELEQ